MPTRTRPHSCVHSGGVAVSTSGTARFESDAFGAWIESAPRQLLMGCACKWAATSSSPLRDGSPSVLLVLRLNVSGTPSERRRSCNLETFAIICCDERSSALIMAAATPAAVPEAHSFG